MTVAAVVSAPTLWPISEAITSLSNNLSLFLPAHPWSVGCWMTNSESTSIHVLSPVPASGAITLKQVLFSFVHTGRTTSWARSDAFQITNRSNTGFKTQNLCRHVCVCVCVCACACVRFCITRQPGTDGFHLCILFFHGIDTKWVSCCSLDTKPAPESCSRYSSYG